MAGQRKQYPSQARLRELFYCDETGHIAWKRNESRSSSWNSKYADKKAGSIYAEASGSVRNKITIDYVSYPMRLIAWIYFYGHLPEGMHVTNIDSNASDCRKCNLKAGKNQRNKGLKKPRGEFYGVRRRSPGSWTCEINGHLLGCFSSAEDAATAYDNAHEQLDKSRPNETEAKKVSKRGRSCNYSKGRRDAAGVEMVPSGRYRAKIHKTNLGTFDTQEEAARAYNIAAYERYGEHGVLNDIPDPLGHGDVF